MRYMAEESPSLWLLALLGVCIGLLGALPSDVAASAGCSLSSSAACKLLRRCGQRSARSGVACHQLGVAFHKGRLGLGPNRSKARALYERACNKRHEDGCVAAGVIYLDGKGVAPNATAAVRLFQRACSRSHKTGCAKLGQLLESGRGIKQNHRQAQRTYAAGCKFGSAVACYHGARLYRDGAGGAKRSQRWATVFFMHGCNLRHKASCYAFAARIARGAGIRRSARRAQKYYRLACKYGHKDACAMIQVPKGRGGAAR